MKEKNRIEARIFKNEKKTNLSLGFANVNAPVSLKLNFSQYPSIHTNYIMSHCTTLWI